MECQDLKVAHVAQICDIFSGKQLPPGEQVIQEKVPRKLGVMVINSGPSSVSHVYES